MDIFKLIFHHDIVFDDHSGREDTHKQKEVSTTLEQFMKPMPTYVKYYFSGTRLTDTPQFGLSTLNDYQQILESLGTVFKNQSLWGPEGKIENGLAERLQKASAHEAFLIGNGGDEYDHEQLQLTEQTGIREKLQTIVPLLDKGILFLATEKAHHGIDLHLFARDNFYESFFNTFKPLTQSPDLRYFSINGKRVGSEKSFYFETWTLNRPPHGFEEVTPEAVLR